MKRIFAVFLILLISIPLPVIAGQEVFKLIKANYSIEVDGDVVQSQLPVLNYNGNTYVPLSQIAELSGAWVSWDNENRKVKVNTLKKSLNDLYASVEPEKDLSVDVALLKSAKVEIEIDKHKYTLETNIYKDFMPVHSIVDDVLRGGITTSLIEDNGEKFSKKMQVQTIWYLFKGDAWKCKYMGRDTFNFANNKAVLSNRSPSFPSFAMDKGYYSYGNKVDPDSGIVDVVIKIVDLNNNAYFLKAVNQRVLTSW